MGRLSGVIRRAPLAVLAAAVALTGCGTFTDNDVVAEVEGAQLDNDQVKVLVAEEVGLDPDEVTVVDGETGRLIVGSFVGTEVLRADLEALDQEVPDFDDEGLGAIEALQGEFQTMINAWTQLPADVILDDEVVAYYDQGPVDSGLVCASHILVETEAEADEVVDALAGGADFAELAAATSIDTGSAAAGGSLGCYPVDQFELQFIPEFVDAALDAEIGVPTEPVESEFGYHVIYLPPADQLDPNSIFGLRLETFDDRYDIAIDARFGEWDPNAIVVPVT